MSPRFDRATTCRRFVQYFAASPLLPIAVRQLSRRTLPFRQGYPIRWSGGRVNWTI
jgi:hypothetical protein